MKMHLATKLFVCPVALTFAASHHVVLASRLPPNKLPSQADYDEQGFRRVVDSTLETVRRVLDRSRAPVQYAADADHTYDDKFSLAESLTNTALAALENTFARLGLDEGKLKELKDLSDGGNRAVTLRLEAKGCSFLGKRVEDDDGSSRLETIETDGNKQKKVTSRKVISKITKYDWQFGLEYNLLAYVGNDADIQGSSIRLSGRRSQSSFTIIGSEKAPHPPVLSPPTIELNLSWFIRQLTASDEATQWAFGIDRNLDSCRTPRRNDDIKDALDFFTAASSWGAAVFSYFMNANRKSLPEDNGVAYNNIRAYEAFVPVIPLFEASVSEKGGTAALEASPLLSPEDIGLLLEEQCRTLDKNLVGIADTFPKQDENTTISASEASIALLSNHLQKISRDASHGINYIENMLRSQLVAAIGKELRPLDFEEFLRSYARKIFKHEYVPRPFTYAVRRPQHYPDGTLSIERDHSDSSRIDASEPIMTISRKIESSAPMYLSLNAATAVEFTGDRYLHAWVLHDFKGDFQTPMSSGINLVARARQFSSFLLIVGTVSGPDSFDPQHAIILQNKDEVLLPLLLEQLPTPKEFKDAIESLSPEQKRFAVAFRNMQLESSVFGACIIQLKPQLEQVLGLPYDSLTKEIRLTQDLLSLFIDYQIPSDLLTYDGDADAPVEEKVKRVEKHVATVLGMIAEAKAKELEDIKIQKEMEKESRGQKAQRAMRFDGESASRILYAEEAMIDESMPVRMMASSAYSDGPHLRSQSAARKEPAPMPQFDTQQILSQETTTQKTGELDVNAIDFTRIPKQLDARFDALDEDSALRPTKIKMGTAWTKKTQKNLLSAPQQTTLGTEEQKAEKNKAFDLLDALSKSGALPIAHSELHVMVAATHRFDKSLMATVFEDNMNPIEKMERSLLIVSSTIHKILPIELLNEAYVSNLKKVSPALFDESKLGIADSST